MQVLYTRYLSRIIVLSLLFRKQFLEIIAIQISTLSFVYKIIVVYYLIVAKTTKTKIDAIIAIIAIILVVAKKIESLISKYTIDC